MACDVAAACTPTPTVRERLEAIACEFERLQAENLNLQHALSAGGPSCQELGAGEESVAARRGRFHSRRRRRATRSGGCSSPASLLAPAAALGGGGGGLSSGDRPAGSLEHSEPALACACGDIAAAPGRELCPSEAPSEQADSLPCGWESAWDARYGVAYYFNRATGERTWLRPPVADGSRLSPPETPFASEASGLTRGAREGKGSDGNSTVKAVDFNLKHGEVEAADLMSSGSSASCESSRELPRQGSRCRSSTASSESATSFISRTTKFNRASVLDPTTTELKAWIPVLGRTTAEWLDWWFHLEEPARNGWLATVIGSKAFEGVCIASIIGNVFITICRTEDAVMHWQDATVADDYYAFEVVFLAFFMLELLLRVWVHRMFYFIGKNAVWNCFDCTLCVACISDMLFGRSSVSGVSWLRIIRLLRISRILFVLRAVRFVRELRLIMASLMGCVCPTLFWSLIMLAFIIHIFALYFVQSVTEFLQTSDDLEVRADLLTFFGSLWDAMLTLWKATSGGDDWSGFYALLLETGSVNGLLFVFFIFFFQGAIFNVMTGIFVEKAMRAATPTWEEQVREKLASDFDVEQELLKVIIMMDEDCSGRLSFDEFQGHLARTPHLRDWFELHGLRIENVQAFFKMLAVVNETEDIAISSFVSACMQLRGDASAVDLHLLQFEVRLLAVSQRNFQEELWRYTQGKGATGRALRKSSGASTVWRKKFPQDLASSRSS